MNFPLYGGLLFALSAANAAPQPLATASVRLSTASGGKSFSTSSPASLSIRNASLRRLILTAYQLRDVQLSGGPGWMDSDRYDLDLTWAAGSVGQPWRKRQGPMLQQLLRDRFQLRFHREKRELPVYVLKVAPGGFRMSPAVPGNCVPLKGNGLPPARGQGHAKYCGLAIKGLNSRLRQTLDGLGMSLSAGLTVLLSNELDRLVLDRTGLTGLFDLHLEWDRQAASDNRADPSIFTALEQQLGLKLESGIAPVDVLVVDRARKPAAGTL